MKIPFVTFKPMEAELDKELREAFDRVYTRSWSSKAWKTQLLRRRLLSTVKVNIV